MILSVSLSLSLFFYFCPSVYVSGIYGYWEILHFGDLGVGKYRNLCMQGFEYLGIHDFWAFGIKRFEDKGIQVFQDVGNWGFWDSKLWKFGDLGVLVLRDLKIYGFVSLAICLLITSSLQAWGKLDQALAAFYAPLSTDCA